jgi:outer membrane protein assembly factor BamB
MRFTRWFCALVTAGVLIAGVTVPVVSGAVAQAATTPVASGVGRTYGGPGHTFAVPTAAAPAGSLVRAWTRNLGGAVASPLIVGSRVVTAVTSSTDGGDRVDVQAFDAVTGTPLWAPIAVGTFPPTLVSDGTRVFVTTMMSITAIDLASGRQLWTSLVSPGVSLYNLPSVSGGLVWVNSGGSGVQGLNPVTGAVVRRYADHRGSGTLALAGTTVYDGQCALDLSTGTVRWTQTGIARCNLDNTLNQSDGSVLLAPAYGNPSLLAARDASTGRVRFTVPTGHAAIGSGQFTVATTNRLVSYDQTSGAQRWSVPLSARPVAAPLLYAGLATVATTDGHLRRYRLSTGALVDDTTLPSAPTQTFGRLAPAVVADSGLLAVPSRNSITVYRGSTSGTPAKAVPAPQPRPTLPATATGSDRADGSQYAQSPGKDGVAVGSTLTAPLRRAWTTTLSGAASNALIDGTGRLYVGAANPAGGVNVYRFNRRTGAVVWGPVALTGGTNTTRLAVQNGVLVSYQYGPGSAVLRGLDAATGAVRWTTTLPVTDYWYDGYPTVAGGSVYVHSYATPTSGIAWALDLQTGKVKWSAPARNDYAGLAPVVGGTRVYYSGVGDQLTALDTATGATLFHTNSGYHGGGTGSAVLAGGRLYLNDYYGSGKVVSASTGQPVGVGMFATRRPAVDATNGVMVALQGNRLTAESLTDRSRYWSYTGSATPTVSPVIANNLVFTGDTSGRLLVLSEATGAVVWSDTGAFAPKSARLLEVEEPAELTVGAGGLALTSGNQLRVYAGAVDNGPRTP